MPNAAYETSIALERAFEQLRQERETFNQLKRHASRWFALQLTIGYVSIVIFGVIAFAACWVLTNNWQFSSGVVIAASTALFVDAIGLVTAVWKIVLNPKFYAPLTPVTRGEVPATAETQNKLP